MLGQFATIQAKPNLAQLDAVVAIVTELRGALASSRRATRRRKRGSLMPFCTERTRRHVAGSPAE
ncbi:MAG: hypothetical protein IPP98_06810 [Gemmatimonadetes bacterium]|nr:hypothetical protein [Gemmatimonadota bacterium]